MWTETVLHAFTGGSDGSVPGLLNTVAGLILDKSGNLYGAAASGGLKPGCCGVAFKLSPPAGGAGSWTETVLHTFTGPDGRAPDSLMFDGSGNLYGSTYEGAGNGSFCHYGCGAAFELSPPVGGSGPWTDKTLFVFSDNRGLTDTGANPLNVLYQNGKLYGAARLVFVLSPSIKKYWAESPTYLNTQTGAGPQGFITDPAVTGTSTFYSAALADGPGGYGTIFSWTP